MRNLIWAVPAILIGMQISASAATVVPGTEIAVRPDQPIELHTWDRGRIYPAHVSRDVFSRNGDIAIPRGAYAELIVRQTGPDQMTLDLESISVNGNRYAVDANGPQVSTENAGGLLGNIVGAITNGQVQVETQGSEIRVPADTLITFQLQQPLHVVAWQDPGYMNNGFHYHHDSDWYR